MMGIVVIRDDGSGGGEYLKFDFLELFKKNVDNK